MAKLQKKSKYYQVLDMISWLKPDSADLVIFSPPFRAESVFKFDRRNTNTTLPSLFRKGKEWVLIYTWAE